MDEISDEYNEIYDAYGIGFWDPIICNKRGIMTQFRWKKFRDVLRNMQIAQSFLDNFMSQASVSYLNTPKGKRHVDIVGELNNTINYLADNYFTVMGKEPGRSKSTIGPFVRYAFEVLSSIPFLQSPKTIDALNERWARSRYKAKKARVIDPFADRYAKKRGIPNPFRKVEVPRGQKFLKHPSLCPGAFSRNGLPLLLPSRSLGVQWQLCSPTRVHSRRNDETKNKRFHRRKTRLLYY